MEALDRTEEDNSLPRKPDAVVVLRAAERIAADRRQQHLTPLEDEYSYESD